MKQERNYNIELLRVISCVMVICIHVANYYSRGYGLGEVSAVSYIFSIVINGVSRVAVPIFFMISGAFLLGCKPDVKKSLKRVWNIFLPLVIWSGIYLVWNYFYRERVYDFRLLLEEPVKKHLWYLYALAGLYLVLPFLQTMLQGMQDMVKKYFALLWFVVLVVEYIFVLCKIKVTYPVPLVGEFCYLGCFVMGYLMYSDSFQVQISQRVSWILASLSIAIAIIWTYLSTVSRGEHYETIFEYRNFLIILAACFLFYNAVHNQHRKYSEREKRILDFLSKHSFTIYLCHIVFLDIVKLEFSPRSISAVVGIPLYVTFIFVCSLLLSVIWHGLWNKVKMIN